MIAANNMRYTLSYIKVKMLQF